MSITKLDQLSHSHLSEQQSVCRSHKTQAKTVQEYEISS